MDLSQSISGVTFPTATLTAQSQTNTAANANFAAILEQAQQDTAQEPVPAVQTAQNNTSSSLFGADGLGSMLLSSMMGGMSGMGDGGISGILSLILLFLFQDTNFGVENSDSASTADDRIITKPSLTDKRLRYGPDGAVDYGAVVGSALTRLGDPYSQAKAGQDDYTDCSYLSRWCYRELGIELPRTAAAQAQYCVKNNLTIDKSELQPGDLIFFSLQKNGRFMDISHVGIYAGNGMMVDASSNYGEVVYREVFNGGQVLYGRPRSV